MDNQSLGVVGTFIINAVAIIWCIRETFVRHGQTKELQDSNARLQSEVNRLSVNLNQEITRLNRINELTRGVYLSSARLHFKYALLAKFEDADSVSRNEEIYSVDDYVNFLTTVEGSTLEMRAIAKVIGDSDLVALINQLREGVSTYSMNESQGEFFQRLDDFGQHATRLYETVYRLLEAATDTREDEGHEEDSNKPT
jgi:hypothetical protein